MSTHLGHERDRIAQFVTEAAEKLNLIAPVRPPLYSPESREEWVRAGTGPVTMEKLEELFRAKCMLRFRKSSEEKRSTFLWTLRHYGWKAVADSVEAEFLVFP